MNPVQRPDSFEAADYVDVLRRRWLTILVLTIIGLIGSLGYALVAPKTYSTTAEVAVTPTGADMTNGVAGSRTNSGSVNLDTEAQNVTSTMIASAAGKIMHSTVPPWQLSQQISVTVPPSSSDLLIACDASSADGSAQCANAFAQAYLHNRSVTSLRSLNAQMTVVQDKVNALNNQAAALSGKVGSLPANSSQRLAAQAQLPGVQNQIHALTGQLSTLTALAANNSGGSIITPATPPGTPTSPKKALVLPAGVVGGLVLGLIIAFLSDRRDKRIHAGKEVERLLDMPVLVDLPMKGFSQQLDLALAQSRTGQAFTEFAYGVAASLGEGSHVIAVAGTTPGAGSSVIAANLAAALARAYSNVVLVCANLDDDVAPDMLGVEEGRGLAEVLAGRATVRDVARRPAAVPGLWVITPGADTSLAIYQLQHDRAQALAAQLRREARFVIIEVQGTEDGADTFALAKFADVAIVTVETPRTTQTSAGECIRRLRQLRTPILGAAVLSAISPKAVVRPPQQGQQRLEAGPDELAPDGLVPEEAAVGRGRPS
jgi:capsular polysaccharide biosynthesis protein/MinD-like ATPase involved in chromosome partitioning or flagellar assembly